MTKPGTLYLLPAPLRPQSVSGWTEPEIAAELPAAAIELMRRLSVFVVESERSAARLLSRILVPDAMKAAEFHVLDEHADSGAMDAPLDLLHSGTDVGLLSEAGTPCVADPGAALVARAHELGIPVRPIAGPSSIMLALSGSGLDAQRFLFLGYLPADQEGRRRALKDQATAFAKDGITRIFIETPYRNAVLLAACVDALPKEILLCVASGLAAPEESIRCMKAGHWKKAGPEAVPGRIPAVFLFGKSASLRPVDTAASRREGVEPGKSGLLRPGKGRSGLRKPGKPAARG